MHRTASSRVPLAPWALVAALAALGACGTGDPAPPADAPAGKASSPAAARPPALPPMTGAWTTEADSLGVYGTWTFAADGALTWQTGPTFCKDGVGRREGTWTQVDGRVVAHWLRENRVIGDRPKADGCDRSAETSYKAVIGWDQDLGITPCVPAAADCAVWLNRPWHRSPG
ncbi:MAG: hypothetical protein H6733_16410 [Alphaproteobacteria bacterium]|nr:hypothetical protein [Alphaproteobacteria bacterium]